MKILPTLILVLALVSGGASRPADQEPSTKERTAMELGSFTICLAVKDIAASRAFYGQLGFAEVAGDITQNWLVLRNGATKVGLFQGMFEQNILTFNPGWDQAGEPLEEFTDVRELQRRLKAAGLALTTEADEAERGPAHFTLSDPDGNQILFDQHVE